MVKILITLIPLFPLFGFLFLGAGFRSLPRRIVSVTGPGTILASFLLTLILFFDFQRNGIPQIHLIFNWLTVGPLVIGFEFLTDPLSLLMMLVVTGVGFLIHWYSVGYMKDDPGYNRFFAYMNLFVFFMLLLVMGANYLIMFIGWEGVGLCSYLLIGFWFRNQDYNNAAKKAFIMNRIGDLGFLLGMFLLFTTFGSLNFREIFEKATPMEAGEPVMVAITLLLFIGAVGKSAQIPLYTWLPDAMAGPTPVSALIHAATMVTAGVYMVARSNILYVLSPVTQIVMGSVALATAIFAASIALFQNDIKKILAYSTISQLGYMFAALSVGAFTGAMFHLTTHAFFKALLFLGAGSVIHALGGEHNIRKMGGLRKKMPATWWTFLIATLAISGIPPLSGFFSKDEILIHALDHSAWMWFILFIGALMTAFYMFRLLWLTFFGAFRGTDDQHHHLHESPGVMTVPLILLAFLTAVGGFMNIPGIFGGNSLLAQFLAPVFAGSKYHPMPVTRISHTTEWMIIGITLAAVIAVIAWSYHHFVKREKGFLPDQAHRNFLVNLISQKYYVDELYELIIVKPLLWLSTILHRIIEVGFIDRIINSFGNLVVRTGNTLRYIQTGNVGFYMFIMILGIILMLFLNILI